MKLPPPIQSSIKKIKTDNVNGAVELTRQAAATLTRLTNLSTPTAAHLIEYIELAAKALINAQPTMAPLFNLANRVLLAVDPAVNDDQIKQIVRQSCRDFVNQIEQSGQRIAGAAAALIEEDMVIMTHSASATVGQAFLAAQRAGQQFEIICTESRPVNEGVKLARRLGRQGFSVKLITDAAAFGLMSEVDMIFVGADSVSPHGLVNKSGTLGLALAAHRFNVDFYGLCGSEKFLPESYALPTEPLKDPGEILAEPADNVTVLNYYFDHTPLDYVSGLITERGVLSPAGLGQIFEDLTIHPALAVV
ncbi:MAG: translation initiation factor eIF-2B [Anaerolineae bacterium]|nr:translation initiation factor eIF-2B [Anaerolineae bacterium]